MEPLCRAGENGHIWEKDESLEGREREDYDSKAKIPPLPTWGWGCPSTDIDYQHLPIPHLPGLTWSTCLFIDLFPYWF